MAIVFFEAEFCKITKNVNFDQKNLQAGFLTSTCQQIESVSGQGICYIPKMSILIKKFGEQTRANFYRAASL
jgi:hypothetical protein